MTIKRGNVPETVPAVVLTWDDAKAGGSCMTVVVLGQIRGNTTPLTVLLTILGINMGPDFGSHEDHEMVTAVCDEPDTGLLDFLLPDLDARYLHWGFKAPRMLAGPHVRAIHKALRHPHYFFAFRDVVAVAGCRLNMTNSDNVDSAIKTCWNEQRGMLEWLDALPSAPKFLVSTERLRRNPVQALEELAAALRLEPPTDTQKRLAEKAALNTDGGYVTTSLTTIRSSLNNEP